MIVVGVASGNKSIFFCQMVPKSPKVLDLFDLKKPILLMMGSTVVKCKLHFCGVAGSIPDKVKHFLSG